MDIDSQLSNGTYEEWLEALRAEVKAPELDRWLRRHQPEGFDSPIFSYQGEAWFDQSFQKAPLSLSWTRIEELNWEEIPQLLAQGVWDFILDPFLLGWDSDQLTRALVQQPPPVIGARLWVCHPTLSLPSGMRRMLSAAAVLSSGGHAALELGFQLDRLIRWASAGGQEELAVAVTMDGEFFKSVAKMRAMKSIAQAALGEMHCEHLWSKLSWAARTSWREFSCFDRANNILRSANAVAAGLVSGAGIVECLPYDLLVDVPTERQRAQRLALATQLILQQESFLNEVDDPSHGSFQIETLTKSIAQAAWEVMQTLQAMPEGQHEAWLVAHSRQHWKEVQRSFNHRKVVQPGVNDFPDPQEKVRVCERWTKSDHVRLAGDFEKLRLRLAEKAPRVAIAVVGDYAALQARLSFARNYFELLGLEVFDSGPKTLIADAHQWLDQQNTEIRVWVANDQTYAQCSALGERCYLAGKTMVDGCLNIYSGQDILEGLRSLVSWWEERV